MKKHSKIGDLMKEKLIIALIIAPMPIVLIVAIIMFAIVFW